MAREAAAEVGPGCLREFPPGYFAFVMRTGIVAVAARLLHFGGLSWLIAWLPFLERIPQALFCIAMLAWVLSFIGMWRRPLRPRPV